jgi:hypothetical protein
VISFRLIERVAEGAITSGKERTDLADFDADHLVLPLVSMPQAAERRGRGPRGGGGLSCATDRSLRRLRERLVVLALREPTGRATSRLHGL